MALAVDLEVGFQHHAATQAPGDTMVSSSVTEHNTDMSNPLHTHRIKNKIKFSWKLIFSIVISKSVYVTEIGVSLS